LAAANGSIFNKLFPWMDLLAENQNQLPDWAQIAMSFAVGIHLLGLNVMVIGLLMFTFGKNKNSI
jgi:hypothetical protein